MLNAVMFVIEFGLGLITQSAALMANSVDILGDVLLYGIPAGNALPSNRDMDRARW